MNAHPRGVTIHNGLFVWQLTVLGRPLRSRQHFDTSEEAALDCDLVRHYLRMEYKLDLVPALDGEQFSSLAYSRRGVVLSDSLSVLKSLPDCVQIFLTEQKAELSAYREAQPPESTASKFRRSGMINNPAIRDWVNKLDAAAQTEEAFTAVNSKSFFLRLSVVERSISTALNSLGMAVRLHGAPINDRLVERVRLLRELETHLNATAAHIKSLSEQFSAEQLAVEVALSILESNRPPLV